MNPPPPLPGLLARLRSEWRESVRFYDGDDDESGWLRAQHLAAVVRLAPVMLAANAVCAVTVGTVALELAPWQFAGWAVLLGLLVVGWLRAWLRSRRGPPAALRPRPLRRSTRHAAVLGALWGLAPLLWFPGASPDGQLLLGTLTVGMVSAGTFVLSPLPRASVAFAVTVLVGVLGALWRQGGPTAAPLAVLIFVFITTCAAGALSAGRKATALLRSQRDSARQHEFVTLLLHDFEQHAHEALWETSGEGRLVHVSPRLADWLGKAPDQMLGRTLAWLLKERMPDGFRQLEKTAERGLPFRDLRVEVIGDPPRWWDVSGKPVPAPGGGPPGWRGVVVDVTARVVAEQRLRQLAHFDPLTGLANRVTLHETLRRVADSGAPGVLMTMDLDRFKAVNDTLGHSAGDAVLAAAAERLRACVRPGDLVARLGGDEFAVLVSSALTEAEALALAQRMVGVFASPCAVHDRVVEVGLSVGVVMLPAHGREVDELLVNADLALYAAKEEGRGRAVLYGASLGERSRRRTAIEGGLRDAVARGQLELHWQPRLDLRSWRVTGAEALMRWQHPVLGRVPPAEFIAVAEQSGAIVELGTWALHEACRAAASELTELTVSVNVSPAQLRSVDFAAVVEGALEASGLEPWRLELELTESLFIGDTETALACLHRLQRLGVRIALDDFGTGYSSLSYLRRFPFDTLKIDRVFVRELPERADSQALVSAMVQMAAALGMRVVAEGVETSPELERVAGLGCHEVQGYLISAPRPLAEVQAVRAAWPPAASPAAAPPALH